MCDLALELAEADFPDFATGFEAAPGLNLNEITDLFDAVPADFLPVDGIEALFDDQLPRRVKTRFTNKWHRLEFVRSKREVKSVHKVYKRRVVKYRC